MANDRNNYNTLVGGEGKIYSDMKKTKWEEKEKRVLYRRKLTNK